jgi:hypothetical protein
LISIHERFRVLSDVGSIDGVTVFITEEEAEAQETFNHRACSIIDFKCQEISIVSLIARDILIVIGCKHGPKIKINLRACFKTHCVFLKMFRNFTFRENYREKAAIF